MVLAIPNTHPQKCHFFTIFTRAIAFKNSISRLGNRYFLGAGVVHQIVNELLNGEGSGTFASIAIAPRSVSPNPLKEGQPLSVNRRSRCCKESRADKLTQQQQLAAQL
ncbi:hypothetical protein WA1_50235 [Scytonema hofmannii PCC 7110]|uniref:Uncharacterized protein n=1 Tax=Scytonema hofmannii PCC 7110 TaxID=128403 RepID=A0A139WR49_9CYAN|nr:hypothetical protein [Scytonema hofmannii]KYC34906.1 hypothetical protein WA1_50235 [Scytonema hofmannii PCC 7110]